MAAAQEAISIETPSSCPGPTPEGQIARSLSAPMGRGKIMEQRKVTVDGWIARQKDGRRLAEDRDRRDAIRQWVTVGDCCRRDHGGDGGFRRAMIHVIQIEATDSV
jgi:hypothetical protein